MAFFLTASNSSSNLIQPISKISTALHLYCHHLSPSHHHLSPGQSQYPPWRYSCIHSVATQRDLITTHPTLKALQTFPLHLDKDKIKIFGSSSHLVHPVMSHCSLLHMWVWRWVNVWTSAFAFQAVNIGHLGAWGWGWERRWVEGDCPFYWDTIGNVTL